MAGKWLTVAEARHVLGIAERTLRRRIQKGDIPSKLEDGRRLVLVEVAESDMPDDMPVAQVDMPGTAALLEHVQRENELLRQQLQEKDRSLEEAHKAATEASQRHDTIVLQLTRQLESQQRLLEYHQDPWYRRWFRKKQEVK
jgi:hypothetical protein